MEDSSSSDSISVHHQLRSTSFSDLSLEKKNFWMYDDEQDDVDPRKPAKQVVVSPQTERKRVMAEVFFLDYYFDLISYIHQRKKRLQRFKKHVTESQLSEEQALSEWQYYCGQERAFLRKRRTRVRFNEFDVLLQIGEGGYGQVFLCRKKDSKELCAVKRMDKTILAQKKRVDNILTERDILTNTQQSPWLVKLLYSFQDQQFVYLAMEYVPGGDMRALLNTIYTMKEEPAKFYVAEMFLAMVSLHALGFIHRDLKPENYLIDERGHIKLTDFGLAKGKLSKEFLDDLKQKLDDIKENKFVQRSSVEKRKLYQELKREDHAARGKTLVGTPDYMAPELLTEDSYDLAVDYWAMGCIIFEMLYGYTPFTGQTIEEIFQNIRCHEMVLERPFFPETDSEGQPSPDYLHVSDEAWDLISRLIAPRDQRITTLKEVQEHPWFDGLDWDTLLGGNTPFIPDLETPEDTKYFDLSGMGDSNLIAVHNPNGGTTYTRKAFLGFTYKHQQWQNTALKNHVIQEVRGMALQTPLRIYS